MKRWSMRQELRKPDAQQSLGEEIVSWIKATCRVPEGVLFGQPIKRMDWRRDAILKIYNNPSTTRRAI